MGQVNAISDCHKCLKCFEVLKVSVTLYPEEAGVFRLVESCLTARKILSNTKFKLLFDVRIPIFKKVRVLLLPDLTNSPQFLRIWKHFGI